MRFAVRLTEGALVGDWAAEQLAEPAAGCVVRFHGTVRNSARGKEVERLEYQAYPRMFQAELTRICEELRDRHDLLGVAVEHAIGVVPTGGVSVAAAVSAAHRHPALQALAELMDELKARVPLWKHEFYTDGSTWIGRGS